MKYLFYKPIEFPEKIHIVSKSLNVDMEYVPFDQGNWPACSFEELFLMAKLDCFDDVQVFLSEHQEAYYKKTKRSWDCYDVTGWISLKEYKNGGGYLEDKFFEFDPAIPTNMENIETETILLEVGTEILMKDGSINVIHSAPPIKQPK